MIMRKLPFLPAQCRCGAGAGGDSFYLLPQTDTRPRLWGMEPKVGAAPIIPPARSYRVAAHEAAHAVVSFLLGRGISGVSVEGQPVFIGGEAPRDQLAAAAVALAGNHGERLIVHRAEIRPFNEEVIRTFDAVREFRFGGCDDCTAAFAIIHRHGLNATDDELLGAYRTVEAATIDLIREPLTSAAIRRLADHLMKVGTVDGDEAHQIIESAGVKFGSRQINI